MVNNLIRIDDSDEYVIPPKTFKWLPLKFTIGAYTLLSQKFCNEDPQEQDGTYLISPPFRTPPCSKQNSLATACKKEDFEVYLREQYKNSIH